MPGCILSFLIEEDWKQLTKLSIIELTYRSSNRLMSALLYKYKFEVL